MPPTWQREQAHVAVPVATESALLVFGLLIVTWHTTVVLPVPGRDARVVRLR